MTSDATRGTPRLGRSLRRACRRYARRRPCAFACGVYRSRGARKEEAEGCLIGTVGGNVQVIGAPLPANMRFVRDGSEAAGWEGLPCGSGATERRMAMTDVVHGTIKRGREAHESLQVA